MKLKAVGAVLSLSIVSGLTWGMPVLAEKPEDEVTRMEEVVVTGTRTPHSLKDVPVETVVVSRKDIENSNAQTVGDILKNIPGVSVSGTDDIFGSATSRIRMHGLDFNGGYGLILIDGQRVQGSTQSGAHGTVAVGLNQIPVSMIEQIEVVKGPASVLYGSDAMIGVINIITRKTPKQKKPTINTGSAVGWFKVNERTRDGETTKASDDGKYRNATEAYVRLGARPFDRFGYQLNYAYENAECVGEVPYENIRHSLMAKTDFTLTDEADFWVKGELSQFERDNDSPREEDTYRIASGLTWKDPNTHYVQVKGYRFYEEFNSQSEKRHTFGEIGYNQIEAQHTWYMGNTHALTTGGEFQHQFVDYIMKSYIDGAFHSEAPIDENLNTVSVYLQDEITVFENLTLVPGIRYDNHSSFDEAYNPKLSAMYRLRPDTTLRASAGKGFKIPTITQLYYAIPWYHSPFWVASNPDLIPEKSMGYTFGIEQLLMESKVILSLSLYRNDVENKIVSEYSDELYNGDELIIYKNVEEAMTQGADVSVIMTFRRNFSVTAGYSFSDTENKETGKALTYVPDHQFNLTPVYEYEPWGIGGSATFAWFSKQYTDTDNTYVQDAHAVLDAKIYKKIARYGKVSLQVDNISDSDKGDERNYRTERTYVVKLDMEF